MAILKWLTILLTVLIIAIDDAYGARLSSYGPCVVGHKSPCNKDYRDHDQVPATPHPNPKQPGGQAASKHPHSTLLDDASRGVDLGSTQKPRGFSHGGHNPNHWRHKFHNPHISFGGWLQICVILSTVNIYCQYVKFCMFVNYGHVLPDN